VIAEALGIKLEDMGELSLKAKKAAGISNTCTVFAELEVVSKLAEGVPVEELVAGLHQAIATRIYGTVNRLKIEKDLVVTGGGAKNIGLVRALEAKLGYPVVVPSEPLLTGAIGAALLGKDIAQRAMEKGEPLPISERRLSEATLFS
jgi:predicted CoA-substrate-specific enzyme activase